MSQASEIYDSFPEEAKDMTKQEFCRRFNAATDPRRMQEDLAWIIHGKREKATIDRALEKRR